MRSSRIRRRFIAVDAKFDGKRMIVGCSREHLAELVEQAMVVCPSELSIMPIKAVLASWGGYGKTRYLHLAASCVAVSFVSA